MALILPGVPLAQVVNAKRWRLTHGWGLALASDPEVAQTLLAAGANQELVDQLTGLLPDTVIEAHLRGALSELGAMLGLRFDTVQVTTPAPGETVPAGHIRGNPQPLISGAAEDYPMLITLPDHVLELRRLRAIVAGVVVSTWSTEAELATLSLEHPAGGMLRVRFDLTDWRLTGQGWYTSWRRLSPPSPVANFWYADYLAGFAPPYTDGTPGHVPEVLDRWVALTAGLSILAQAGAAATAGLASGSISMDGLSRSLSLPSTGIWGYYLTQMKDARDRIDTIGLKALYNPRRVYSLRGGGAP